MNQKNIRNFSIIAHIDHGKSTLADRFLEVTKTVLQMKMQEQMLDSMDLERERGITIKMQPVNMEYTSRGEKYCLNLIDTPGHSDFAYEVSRALAACEGAVLLVDATQGVEAQTIANLEVAISNDLTIIPVINKIDLPNANVEKVEKEIESILGIKGEKIYHVSAKTGLGVPELLEGIIEKVPPPKGNPEGQLRALVFDSYYDSYRGVRASIRIVDGSLKNTDTIAVRSHGKSAKVVSLGFFKPQLTKAQEIPCGMTGYIETGYKTIRDCRVGDTIVLQGQTPEALSGYEEPQPKVFAGIFLSENAEVSVLTQALEKLQSNDAALTFAPIRSDALGLGHRLGLLGLLHLEIVQERLEREFNLKVIVASPSVTYKVKEKDSPQEKIIRSPSELASPELIEMVLEPYARVEIVTLVPYMGKIIDLCKTRRGEYKTSNYFGEQSVSLVFEMPMAEIIADFYDSLKKISSGYASFSYEQLDFRAGDLVKLDIMVNGEIVDALSQILPRADAVRKGRAVTEVLKDKIPRRQFEIALQAAVYGKILARTNIPALRKDVTAKLYGGDVTRKRKLLEKQKSGKKRLKEVGGVAIPQEAFLSVLRAGNDN
jgi:GTP-binding protein LepA